MDPRERIAGESGLGVPVQMAEGYFTFPEDQRRGVVDALVSVVATLPKRDEVVYSKPGHKLAVSRVYQNAAVVYAQTVDPEFSRERAAEISQAGDAYRRFHGMIDGLSQEEAMEGLAILQQLQSLPRT